MIVNCRACGKTWRYPCEPCRDGFIDYHRAEFGHDVTVHQPEERRLMRRPRADFPSWMYRSRDAKTV